MKIDTKPFGFIEVADKQVIEFAYGIPGFSGLKQFALLDSGQQPFYWLQSTEDVEVAFILIDPFLISPKYSLDIPETEFETIGLSSKDLKQLLFVIVTVRENGHKITVNLQGPVVINPENRMGRQFISSNPNWPIQFNIMDELQAMQTEENDNADINQKKE